MVRIARLYFAECTVPCSTHLAKYFCSTYVLGRVGLQLVRTLEVISCTCKVFQPHTRQPHHARGFGRLAHVVPTEEACSLEALLAQLEFLCLKLSEITRGTYNCYGVTYWSSRLFNWISKKVYPLYLTEGVHQFAIAYSN